jgi:hypothetical protein
MERIDKVAGCPHIEVRLRRYFIPQPISFAIFFDQHVCTTRIGRLSQCVGHSLTEEAIVVTGGIFPSSVSSHIHCPIFAAEAIKYRSRHSKGAPDWDRRERVAIYISHARLSGHHHCCQLASKRLSGDLIAQRGDGIRSRRTVRPPIPLIFLLSLVSPGKWARAAHTV